MGMLKDFKDYILPPKIVTAEEFIEQFEKEQEEKFNSKEETLKRLKLNKVPCSLTSEDFYGNGNSDSTKSKYRQLKQFIKDREAFEKEWE